VGLDAGREKRGEVAIFREGIPSGWQARTVGKVGSSRQYSGSEIRWRSTGIGRAGRAEAEPEQAAQLIGGDDPVRAAMQVADAVKPFEHQGHQNEHADEQNAIGVVVADVLQTVTIPGIVEALVLNLPAARRERGNLIAWPGRCGRRY